MQLFWHRRDLRVPDNRGLAAAAEASPVVPVFVFDPDVLAYAGPPRAAVMLDALASLRRAYRDRGSDLVVATGDPVAVLPRLADDHDADCVVWNEDYTGLATERDEAVREALDDAGVAAATHHDAVLHEPGSILTTAGEPYAVYSYYWRKWRDRPKDDPVAAPPDDRLAAASGDPLPSLDDLGFAAPDADLPAVGTGAAWKRLTTFCGGDIYRYAEDRDYPAERATSRLSQDLAFGTVGVREVFRETERAAMTATGDARESVEAFQSQLAWREFYVQVLAANPGFVTQNGRSFDDPIPWRNDPEEIQAWKDGRTGFPIIDAGMRQLRAEAFVHNRVRMLVASFLTKDLLVDWRVGYRWFRERLVDHYAPSEAGGWQWVASTGVDAQPSFRVFNPTTQAERFDPEAAYITEYVPELRGASSEQIHGWRALDDAARQAVAPGYPAPIVDHANRREQAVAAFERARE